MALRSTLEAMAVVEQPVEAPGIRKLSVEEVRLMVEAGILGDTERLELIAGRLVVMSPEGTDHSFVISRLTRRIAAWYPPEYAVRVQSTLPIEPVSFVVPDLYVATSDPRDRFPSAAEILLAVEVAVSSRGWDIGGKSILYARFGIGTYWVVDVLGDAVVVHGDPGPDGYRTLRTRRGDDTVTLPGLDRTITAAEILQG